MSSNESRSENRALIYRIISQSFEYPTSALLDSLKSDDYWQALLEVFEAVDERLVNLTGNAMQTIVQEAEQSALLGFEIEYNRLFRMSHAEYACPMTASEYLKGESRQALAVAQLRGLYRTFGLEIKANHEPDHVSVLSEFMSWLCAKERRAIENSNEEGRKDCIRAQSMVVEDYLSFMPLFTKSVCHHAQLEYYRFLALASLEFIASERKLLLPASPLTC